MIPLIHSIYKKIRGRFKKRPQDHPNIEYTTYYSPQPDDPDTRAIIFVSGVNAEELKQAIESSKDIKYSAYIHSVSLWGNRLNE